MMARKYMGNAAKMSQALAIALLALAWIGGSEAYNLHEGVARSIAYNRRASGTHEPECTSEDCVGAAARLPGDAPSFGLLHIDHHPESPFQAAPTLLAKIKNGVQRSRQRAALVRSIISPNFSTQRGLDFDPSVDDVTNLAASSFQEPLSASPGSYVMTISLGTNAQTKTAIADTGSDLTWVQCAPCTQCYAQDDPIYAPTRSTTYKKMAYTNPFCSDLPQKSNSGGFCTYRYGYGDQSTTQGDFAFETITLTTTSGAKTTVPNFAFGCGHRNQGTFSGTDGLVGLGQGSFSFPEQLGSLFGNKFSYCLVSIGSAASVSSPIIFGESSLASNANLQYTPLVSNSRNPTFYYVTLKDISVGGQALNLPASTFSIKSSGTGGVILDSGTTITQLIQAAYTPFVNKLKSLIKYPRADSSEIGLDLCYNTAGVTNPSFPAIVLKFAGVDVSLPADNSFVLVDEEGTICLAFAGTSDFTIIGNIQQQNYFYLYDRENQRVGIAPAQCDSLNVGAGAVSS